MSTERMPKILIVGAGGIGGLAFDLIIPALNKIKKMFHHHHGWRYR